MLHSAGYEVSSAPSQKEGFRVVRAGAVDVFSYGLASSDYPSIKSSGLKYDSYYGASYAIDLNPAKLHMTVPADFRRNSEIPGILVLHYADVADEDVQTAQGFRYTRPLRTILDLIEGIKLETHKTVLLVEHRMDVVTRLADRIIVLQDGMLIADGPPADVVALPVVQQAYLGVHGAGELRRGSPQ